MSHPIPTVKVIPWGEDQGDYVLINDFDFDPYLFVLFEEPAAADETPVEEPAAADSDPAPAKKGAK
jgi:hypothetical protein